MSKLAGRTVFPGFCSQGSIKIPPRQISHLNRFLQGFSIALNHAYPLWLRRTWHWSSTPCWPTWASHNVAPIIVKSRAVVLANINPGQPRYFCARPSQCHCSSYIVFSSAIEDTSIFNFMLSDNCPVGVAPMLSVFVTWVFIYSFAWLLPRTQGLPTGQLSQSASGGHRRELQPSNFSFRPLVPLSVSFFSSLVSSLPYRLVKRYLIHCKVFDNFHFITKNFRSWPLPAQKSSVLIKQIFVAFHQELPATHSNE